MGIFQRTILSKQIASNAEKIQQAYKLYAACFLNPAIQENIRNSKEEQFQEGFLRELFVKVLGYTLNPDPDFNLITEQKNVTDAKKADAAIRVGGEVRGVIELKDHKTTDLKQVEAQAFGYKNNNRKTSYVVISNFEKLRFYIDNTIDFEEFNLFKLSQDDFAVLWICLAYENIAKDLPKHLKAESVSNEDQITKKLYLDYSTFKQALFSNIVENNPQQDKLELFRKTQKLLDRFLFVFFAEDKGLLSPNSMSRIVEQWDNRNDDPLNEYQPLYERFRLYFKYLNEGYKGKKEDIFGYNGGLFKPDALLDTLIISDDVLKANILKMIAYDFDTEVDVNILGHIFENSLSEIEEITNQLQTGKTATSKRKKDGVFYTPRYITSYIVENTLGKLCADKKAEMGITNLSGFEDLSGLQAKKEKKLFLEKLDKYREWLLSLTICDPACGSGAFLNAALDFLMNEHRLIDEMTAKLLGNAIVFPNIEDAILENNLYGVDINDESVEIARLSLWLRTAKPQRKLNLLNNNIKCGNSLISDPEVAGEKAFDWHKEFPQVFEKGGFDVVIGNPPYLNMTQTNTPNLNYYIDKYQSVKTANSKNLYTLFNEKAVSLIKMNGLVSFIIPEGFLKTRSYADCVKAMTDEGTITTAVYFEDWVFEDATTGSMIFKFVKNKEDYPFEEYLCNSSKEISKIEVKFNPVVEKYAKLDFPVLSDVADLFKGMVVNDREAVIFTEKGDNPHVFLLGNCMDRYKLKCRYYTDYSKLTIVGGTKSKSKHAIFPRILIRRTGDFLCCVLLTEPALTESTLYSCSVIDNKLDIRYLLAILNSKLLTYIVRKNMITNAQAFPQIMMTDIQTLKIPCIAKKDQQPFITLADKMLALNADLQTKRQRFLRRLTDNISGIKVTGALEHFDELDFKQFVAELGKQKIKLPFKQQDELEAYFNEYCAECRNFVGLIEAADREIDGLVYALYGLTEEEINIIDDN